MQQTHHATPGPRDDRFWAVMETAAFDADEAAGSTIALVRRKIEQRARQALERAVRVQKNVRDYINAVGRILALNYDDGSMVEEQELNWVIGVLRHIHRSSRHMAAGVRREVGERKNGLLASMDDEIVEQAKQLDVLLGRLSKFAIGSGARRSTSGLRLVTNGCVSDTRVEPAPSDDWNSPKPTLTFDEIEHEG